MLGRHMCDWNIVACDVKHQQTHFKRACYQTMLQQSHPQETPFPHTKVWLYGINSLMCPPETLVQDNVLRWVCYPTVLQQSPPLRTLSHPQNFDSDCFLELYRAHSKLVQDSHFVLEAHQLLSPVVLLRLSFSSRQILTVTTY